MSNEGVEYVNGFAFPRVKPSTSQSVSYAEPTIALGDSTETRPTSAVNNLSKPKKASGSKAKKSTAANSVAAKKKAATSTKSVKGKEKQPALEFELDAPVVAVSKGTKGKSHLKGKSAPTSSDHAKAKSSNNKKKKSQPRATSVAEEELEYMDTLPGGLDSTVPMGRAYDPDGESDEEDDREWCTCKTKYQPGMLMICCDICDDWYHPKCLGMDEDDVGLVNSFFCPNCQQTTGKRTTWFAPCSRHNCKNAQQALSKFCSDYCGMDVAAAKLEKIGFDPMDLWDMVANAQKRQGFVLLHDPHAPEQTEESFKLPLFSSDTPPSVQTKTRALQEHSPSKVRLNSALPVFDEVKEDLAAERKSQSIKNGMQKNARQLEEIRANIKLVEARLKLYQIAHRQWEEAASQRNAEPSDTTIITTTKKKGGGTAQPGSDAPCGFDERLAWDPDEWAIWAQSDRGRAKLHGNEDVSADERGLICTTPRKRCDRHSGWPKLYGSALDLEISLERRKDEKLEMNNSQLDMQLQEHQQLQASLVSQRRTRPGGGRLPPVNILNNLPL